MLVPSASPPQQRDVQAPPHPVALRMVSRMSATDERLLSICISGQQLALLKKLDYPCSEAVLASAALIDDEGYELTGSRVDFEMLAGFVAGDANHSRAGRRRDQLHDIADSLESALAARAYAR